MNYAQAVCDALDDLDRTPFGDMGKALNELAEKAAKNLRMHDELVAALREVRGGIANDCCMTWLVRKQIDRALASLKEG